MFGLHDGAPHNSSFEFLGYETQYFLFNMGSALFVFWIFVVLLMIYPCDEYIESVLEDEEKTRFNAFLRRNMCWNIFVTFFQELYLEICFSAVLAYLKLGEEEASWGLVFSHIHAIFFTGVAVLLPLMLLFALIPNFSKLGEESWKSRIGEMYSNLNITESRNVLMYPLVFFLRRIAFVVVVFALEKYPTFQIFFLVFQVEAFIIMIYYAEPLADKRTNTFELFNEAYVLVLVYHLISFTDFVPSPDTRYTMGFSMIGFTCLQIALNVLLLLKGIYRYLKRALQKKLYEYKLADWQKKQLKK